MKRIIFLVAFLLLGSPAWACDHYARLYATATTADFCLWKVDGSEFKTDASVSAGEVKIAKDEGAEANCSTGSGACVTDEGSCYSIALTSGEMTAARIYITVIDTATKTFLDKCLVIETYGDPSAQNTTPDVNVTQWSGTAVATPDTAGYVKATIKDGTGTGEIDTSSGVVFADVTKWKGTTAATVDSAGYVKATIKSGTGTGELSLSSGTVTVGSNSDKTGYSLASDSISSTTVAASGANKIADHVLRRNSSNVEGSSDGDTLSIRSLYGVAAIQTHKNRILSGEWVTYKSDNTTELATRATTSSSTAAPLTGVGP